jgi:hypothetical protein
MLKGEGNFLLRDAVAQILPALPVLSAAEAGRTQDAVNGVITKACSTALWSVH